MSECLSVDSEVLLLSAPVGHSPKDRLLHPLVRGQLFTEIPQDLYIPPDALAVFLEAFEGPLDLLLYLIRKHNLDILDIPIAAITRQYIEYINIMRELRLDLAAEYLVMAATLAEIKSRMLLPRADLPEEEDFDPRAELIRRLQEYEQFKKAAQNLEQVPRWGRDIFMPHVETPKIVTVKIPTLELQELVGSFLDILKRVDLNSAHMIQREALSVRERMASILAALEGKTFIPFYHMFTLEEGRLGVVVTFLATLELLKNHLVDIVQTEPFGPIHIKAVCHEG